MNDREAFVPEPAGGVRIEKDGGLWTLVLTRTLRHSPDRVWKALTDPAQLKFWAPFDADIGLDRPGATVKLTTVGAPHPMVSESKVTKAEAPRLLEYDWGGRPVRWELDPVEAGTRLVLWAGIDRAYIAMGAAGWHLCLEVLDRQLAGTPVGRIVGPEAMAFAGWQRLHQEYRTLFDKEN